MFQSDTKLPHVLRPGSYFRESAYQGEISDLLAAGWHVVGTTVELASPGDFITRQVAGVQLQVRNFDGELRALSNVCAHRHSLICSSACGNSSKMRCQYHGWEYQADGRTGRIPQPKNFMPFDSDTTCLPTYRVETAGQLVFVSVADQPPSLQSFFGAEFYQWICERFSDAWIPSLAWEPNYQTNWKVPIENSLEAYHVPAVHPNTFREDPGAERSEHGLLENRTWFRTMLPFSPHSKLDANFQRLETRFVKWIGGEPTGRYQQHHVFPNLLFSFTDAISLCNCVLPTGPRSCTAIVRQFGRQPERGMVKGAVARFWARIAAAITKRVLIEDLEMFPAIQEGIENSPHEGVLGRCEERIHRFQQHVHTTVGDNE